MKKMIKIAVDAMGGDNSPKKIIDGIELHQKKSKDILYKLFGDKNVIEPIIKKKSIDHTMIELIHTEEKIKGEDSAFTAAKRGKKTSMWLAIESVKNNLSDINYENLIESGFAKSDHKFKSLFGVTYRAVFFSG